MHSTRRGIINLFHPTANRDAYARARADAIDQTGRRTRFLLGPQGLYARTSLPLPSITTNPLFPISTAALTTAASGTPEHWTAVGPWGYARGAASLVSN